MSEGWLWASFCTGKRRSQCGSKGSAKPDSVSFSGTVQGQQQNQLGGPSSQNSRLVVVPHMRSRKSPVGGAAVVVMTSTSSPVSHPLRRAAAFASSLAFHSTCTAQPISMSRRLPAFLGSSLPSQELCRKAMSSIHSGLRLFAPGGSRDKGSCTPGVVSSVCQQTSITAAPVRESATLSFSSGRHAPAGRGLRRPRARG